MQVTFMRTNSDRKALHKKFESKTADDTLAVDITLRGDCEKLSPVLIMKGRNFERYNYVHIPQFNRYYFIDRITCVRDDLLEIYCSCDVLMSHQAEIENLTCLIKRQEYKRNTQIIDNELTAQADTNFVCKQFGDAVISDSNYNIYLTSCGGVN